MRPTPLSRIAREGRRAGGALRSPAMLVLFTVAYVGAFPPNDLWPLALVAYVPLIAAIDGEAPMRSMMTGLLFGTVMAVAAIPWLTEVVRRQSGGSAVTAYVLTVLFCSLQGSRVGVHAFLYSRCVLNGWPSHFAFITSFAVSELAVPALFPWHFATTVHNAPVLTQTAELGGPVAVGVVLVAVNWSLAQLVVFHRGQQRAALILLSGALGAVIFGVWRLADLGRWLSDAPPITIGIVQPNGDVADKRSGGLTALARAKVLTRALRSQPTDAVVWPETGYAVPTLDEEWLAPTHAFGVRLGVPAIVGAVLTRGDAGSGASLYNSAIALDAEGNVSGRYDKRGLMPFGEYVPFGVHFPVLYKMLPNVAHFRVGGSNAGMSLLVAGEKHRIATVICYEDILPGLSRDVVNDAKPGLLVSISNDTFFGDTAAPWQHLAMAQLRAVEHRLFFVRSSNSGPSAIIDPFGRVVSATTAFVPTALRGTVRWGRGDMTLYERLGDAPAWALGSMCVVASLFRRRRPDAEHPRVQWGIGER